MPLTPTAWGGWAAALASAALLVVVLVRDVGLSFGNGWTIVLGAGGGTLAIVATSWVERILAAVLVFLAMVTALFVGLGLLYVPGLALMAFGVGTRGE